MMLFRFAQNWPLLNKHMKTFAAKLRFAIQFEATRDPVPPAGGVQAMWFSNVQALNGEMTSPAPETLEREKG